METNRRAVFCSGVLLAAAVTVASCASETMVHPVAIDQKIEAARDRADHDEIASLYDQQAGKDRAAAEQHRRLAQVYRGRTSRNIPPDMANHCDNLAQVYEQAAAEHSQLAKEHRRIAHELKE